MTHDSRDSRLLADHETLQALRQCSSIFDFEAGGEPPDRYTLSFRGKGVSQCISSRADIEMIELHRIDMRLPFAYPDTPPDLRWVTPILHPNVSFSGFIHLRDVGLPWDDSVTLDAVCERLWDVARMAYMNLDRTTNYSAKSWLEKQQGVVFPVDPRPLRDKMPPAGANVVRYQRRGQPPPRRPPAGGEIFYIGEDTPDPPLPDRQHRPRYPRPGDDDDILFIDDE